MSKPQKQIYEFGEFRVDAAKRLLFNAAGEQISLMPKAFDTLLYLIEHNGKIIEKDELMSAIWADTVVEENNLNQNISILRRVLGEKRGEHRFIATVPGKGFKFVAEVREIEESEKARKGEGKNEAQSPKTENQIRISHFAIRNRRIWLAAIIGITVVGFGIVTFNSWRENTKPSTDTPIKTIAVLPFKPLVAENRDEALELGMADTLISKLSGGEITVRPLSAIRRYNSIEQDSLIAGRELNVETVLDGNVQHLGDKIRINVRLINVADGRQLWAGQFDEEFTDIFAVQNSISERVAAALQTRLEKHSTNRHTKNVKAYEFYLKGRFYIYKLNPAETAKGINYFEQAIEIDPNYALAYVGIAAAYRALMLASDAPPNETMPKAKAAALRAVKIDETLADAHVELGTIAHFYDWDWQAAEEHLSRALVLNPNSADARLYYAHLFSNLGQHEKALAEAKRAVELDLLDLRINALEGQSLFYAGRYEEAIDRLNKTIDLDPNFWMPRLFIARAYIEKGMYRESIAEATKARELGSPNVELIALVGCALAKSGERGEARAVLAELKKLSAERYVPPYYIALVHNALGESDETLALLEKGFAEKDVRMVFLKVEPKWNNIRNEPRFIELIRRMNFE